MTGHVSERSRLAAALMAFFLGWLGVHRFYVGKIGTAILMVITVGGFGIWATIDLIMILVGAFTDEAGRPLREWVPEAGTTSDTPESDLEGRMDRIDSQLTDLQGVLIDMTDKLDRRQYGHLV
ncbi:MAG TPA: TM2 domain-containing protein [Candidatus Latescibacteria bacterium]|jgi:hypothetical protein|nr:hypothetical protein [Gemmatimonadaceae bacterium]MDP6019062.1 TM2 domain-containing protein [Candidatus Latescibacterota bacterium]HJP29559.1 TM2 domain-containing protein [Candidatus Latescibacterota bacterium]|tara:strand:+ start:229 stop:597 length:369 start_codon:yes stop_codon:yes gene_type:complete